MGRELGLDLGDKSSVGLSPNTVLPSHQYYLKKRYKKGKPTGKDDFSKLKEDFVEIKFACFLSSSYKNLPSTETRRGSAYQSSDEVKNIKKIGNMEGRKKIEISCRSSDASFSGSIVDSLCGSDDEDSEQRPSVMSQNSDMASPSVSGSWPCTERNSPDVFIDFSINSDDCNSPLPKDTVQALHKSLSAKVEVSGLLSTPESDHSSRSSPKTTFSPIRKRLNPFTKSKSLRSPVSPILKNAAVKSTWTANVIRNQTYRKSLLNDFSNTTKNSDIISEFINRDIRYSGLACSPVHLQGNFKLKNKQGLPFFEFRVMCPEDVFVAKTWRAGNDLNWVYTFHSINSRKKSNATSSRSHSCDKDSSMVAQMLVSCNLSSELEGGLFGNSMATEFVLYDLARSRRSASREKTSKREQDDSRTLKASRVRAKGETLGTDEERPAIRNKLPTSNVDFDDSSSCPLSAAELHPNLEIAAIVLQIPFHKRESLKYKRGEVIDAKAYSKLSNRKGTDKKMMEQVKVVLPTGNHGLPNAESEGPSSLLNRWKHGGGCDCGGWDMACPLILLGNPSIRFAEDNPLVKEYQPLELLLQGGKENSPSFRMTRIEEDQYAVDFHAQLSPLQAFSICVAILHGASASSDARQEKRQQILPQCNSLKMLIEEEAKFSIKSVTMEERKTVSKSSSTHKGIGRPYAMKPPFSPIARV